MSLEAEAVRGKRAQEVLENAIYIEAFSGIEAEIIRQWREARDTGDREQLHQLLGLLGKLGTALESVMRTGELATAELARKASRAEQVANVYHRRWG